MRLDECVEIAFSSVHEVDKGLPGALDDFELAECLHLTEEMDHLGLNDARVMPVVVQI